MKREFNNGYCNILTLGGVRSGSNRGGSKSLCLKPVC